MVCSSGEFSGESISTTQKGAVADSHRKLWEKLETEKKSRGDDFISDSYSTIRRHSTIRFQSKHLFRSSRETTIFRKFLAEFCSGQIAENGICLIMTGISIEDFDLYFAKHIPSVSVYRLRHLLRFGHYRVSCGKNSMANTMLLCSGKG